MEIRQELYSFIPNEHSKIESKSVKQEESIFEKQKANQEEPKIFDIFREDGESFPSDWEDSKIDYNDIPDGVSRYKYKGGDYTIHKHHGRHKREYVGPKGVDPRDFIDNFPNVVPEDIFPYKDDTTDIDTDTDINTDTDTNKDADINKAADTNTNKRTVNGINGKIDEQVLQGNSGDCWLLVALNSLNSTDAGKKVIEDAITINDDNSVTISFKGVGASYTLTADEIAKYDTDNNLSDSYSNGDNDVLAFELATEKLLKDIKSGKVKVNSSNPNIKNATSSIENGGFPSQMIYYLTGIESQEYYNTDSKGNIKDLEANEVYNILQNAYKSGNTSLTFGIYNGEHRGTLTNGTDYSLDVGNGGHALSITNITADTVTFINPWDNNKEYTMTYSEFANLGIGYMCSSNLNNKNYANKVVDMTDKTTAKNNNYNYSNNNKKYSQKYNNTPTSKASANKKSANSYKYGYDSAFETTNNKSKKKSFFMTFLERIKNSSNSLREFYQDLYKNDDTNKKAS